MEQWRRVEEVQTKRLLLLLSSIALGGCGIWCMHFTGMTAIELRLEDGSTLEIDYELGYTALSLAFAIAGVLIGIKIASSDPYFVEMQAERRKEMLVRMQPVYLDSGE
jgi:NO-binding membrane sensor protein with MHYT domain